jgi:hypothetical protein
MSRFLASFRAFFEYILQHLLVERQIRNDLLEFAVFLFQLFQAPVMEPRMGARAGFESTDGNMDIQDDNWYSRKRLRKQQWCQHWTKQ